MANLLANPRKWKKKIIVLVDEASYGIDGLPTGALNWFEARNVSLTSFDVETADRNIEMPAMGNGGKIITSIWSKLSFDIAIGGSGTAGTAPKYAPALLGCGLAETLSAGVSATYNLASAGHKSASAYMEIDGILYKFIGSRGNVKGSMPAKGVGKYTFSFDSFYTTPVTGSLTGLDKTGWTYEDGINSVNTGALVVDGVNLAFQGFDWDLGNQMGRIDLPGPQREVAITDRKPTANATVLAPALATFNPFTLAEAGTVVAVTNTHGIVAGKKAKTDLKSRIIGVAEDQIEGMAAWKLTLEPFQDAGDDEFALTIK